MHSLALIASRWSAWVSGQTEEVPASDDPQYDDSEGQTNRSPAFFGEFEWLRAPRVEHETGLGQFTRQSQQPQGEHSERAGSAGPWIRLLMSALAESCTPWAGHSASCGSAGSAHNEALAFVACAAGKRRALCRRRTSLSCRP